MRGILTARLALLHPDGSITVLPPRTPLDRARHEAIGLDENQDDPAKWTRLARLRIASIRTIETPSALPTARVARRESCRG